MSVFPNQNMAGPSQMKATLEIRQMSVFGSQTRGKSAQRSDRKPEESQRNDQIQACKQVDEKKVPRSVRALPGWTSSVCHSTRARPGHPYVLAAARKVDPKSNSKEGFHNYKVANSKEGFHNYKVANPKEGFHNYKSQIQKRVPS